MTIHDYTIDLCYELTKLRESNAHLVRLLSAAVRKSGGTLTVNVEPDLFEIIAAKDTDSNLVTITLGKEGE